MWTKKNGLWFLGFLGFLFVENITDRLLDRAIDWIWPEVPLIMFFIYNIVATLVSIGFAMAIVYALWLGLKSVWNLKNGEQRREVWENAKAKVQQWPTGKRDALTAIVMTWSIAICVPIFVLIVTVPEGSLVGRVPIETPLITLAVTITPIYAFFLWNVYEFLKQLKQDWFTETRKGRIRIALTVIVFVVFVAFMALGIITGWEDKLWFNN